MPGKAITTILLILAITISPFATLADEGMWMPGAIDKLPLSQLKKRGFELKPEDIYSTTAPSLKDAIVQISIGGTGSFVSPEGLILTNHHVAFGAVTRASTTENDYINNGFLASSRAEEIPARGYTVSVTQDYRDVTAEVLSAITPGMSAADRTKAITAKQREIQTAASEGKAAEGLRAQVVEASGGFQYFLYTYLTLRDVRLVYAPPKSIGYFGGDPDNFEWPRHCGDFAFLRAYTGPDGKPAAYGKDNIPFKPKRFLSINANGIKEGDFAMIMGFPGSTFRHRESYSVEFRQNVQLPDQIATLRQQIGILTELGEKDPALKIRLAEQIFGLSNSLKAFEGTVKGLKRMNLVEKKRAEEAAFTRWTDANPARKARYGEVLPKIAALYADLNSFSAKQSVLGSLLNSGDLINAMEFVYGRALDREKPEGERSPQFSDQAVQRVKAQLGAAWKERQPESEANLLAAALSRADDLPVGQKLPFIESLFTGKTGKERRKAEAEFAEKAITNSPYNSTDEFNKLFDAPAEQFRTSGDPLLQLVVKSYEEAAPLTAKVGEFNNSITQLRPLYVAGMQEMKKGLYYPDANFTLRFTYGDVRGYRPRDAMIYEPQTKLAGVIEKDTGEDPFAVPAKLRELHRSRDYGNYIDPRLNDVPVAFLTTNDITGGNSGSPVMNGRGEIIGLAFDGNYEGLGGDYAFDQSVNRTLAVDIRYALFITDKFAGASYLFNEMKIIRGKSAAATR